MKVQVEKAQAFEIDPNKKYLVTFEADHEIGPDEAQYIREQILEMFTKVGATATDVVVTSNARIKITEVKE